MTIRMACYVGAEKRRNYNSQTCVCVGGIHTGHGKIRVYLHRFGLTGNPKCPREEEEQTTDHLIFQCKKLRNQRNEMIKQIKTLVAIGLRRMKHSSIIIYRFL